MQSNAMPIALTVVIWTVTSIPAVLVVLWLGLVEQTWLGALKGFVAITAIGVTFGLFQRWIERQIRARRARSAARKHPEP